MGTPDRLFGVCEGCDHWYLVDAAPGQAEGMPAGLTGDEVVRALSRPDPSGGISLMGSDPGPGRRPRK
jgi:hypothetical protein